MIAPIGTSSAHAGGEPFAGADSGAQDRQEGAVVGLCAPRLDNGGRQGAPLPDHERTSDDQGSTQSQTGSSIFLPAVDEPEIGERIRIVRNAVTGLDPSVAKQVIIVMAQDEIGLLSVGAATELIRDLNLGSA